MVPAMVAYYNEIDPFAVAWLRELVAAGHIAPGDVDERSIEDVRSTDLVGYRQVHFFAGIGGWSLAARLAGWPDDRPLWTGSAPCQPFSAAGRRGGTDDERHLWPVMQDLVAVCRPPVVVGEQVASGLGRDWLSAVRSDLETLGYAVGAADLCAAGVGAPHIRQRLYWGAVGVGDTGGKGLPVREREALGGAWRRDARRATQQPSEASHGRERDARHGGWADADLIACRDGKWRPVGPGSFPLAHGVSNPVGRLRGYGNAIVPQVAATFLRALVGDP